MPYMQSGRYPSGNGRREVKDMPVFATEFGEASLLLRQIPYNGAAYVQIHSAREPERLIRLCALYCRESGAQQVYASGHPALEKWDYYTSIWQMCCARRDLPAADQKVGLFPVMQRTLPQFLELYNHRMRDVPLARALTPEDVEEMMRRGSAYFVHRGGHTLGIGAAGGDTIEAVATSVRGTGREIVLALCGILTGEDIRLEVAQTNWRAVRLYESLGFVKTGECSRWYQI